MKPACLLQYVSQSSVWTVRVKRWSLCALAVVGLVMSQANSSLAADNVPAWLKPLAWTNPAERQPKTSTQSESSPLTKPFELRSDTPVTPREDEYTMSEPTLAKAKLPFSWENPADASPPPRRKLTDEEQIEFEKQNYVWIRPFYWDNKVQPEQVNEVPWHYYSDDTSGRFASSLLAPFSWSNRTTRSQRTNSRPALAYNDAILRRLPPIDLAASTTGTTVAVQFQEEQAAEELAPGVAEGGSGDATQELSDQLPLDKWVEDNVEHIGPPLEGEGEFTEGEGGGVLAEAESLGEEPDTRNSLQFLRADTVLLDPGEAQFDYGVTYTLFDIIIPAVNGSSELENARFRQRELLTPLEIRYGLTRRLQVFANVPFGWSNIELTLSDFERFENDGGIGDVVFGGSFLVREGNQCCSDIVWTNSCSAPTGSGSLVPIGAQANQPSLGTGTWSLASNLLFIRTYDPLVVFHGFGTRQHFTTDVAGQSFRPGQEYNYQMGVGFAVNSKVTLSSRFSGAYITEARLDGQRFLGTIREPMVVSLSLTIAQCNGLVEPFIDFGITDEALNSRFGVVWTRF